MSWRSQKRIRDLQYFARCNAEDEQISCRQMIEEITTIEEALCNEWERGFMDDMRKWASMPGGFSQKQQAIIRRIYNKVRAQTQRS